MLRTYQGARAGRLAGACAQRGVSPALAAPLILATLPPPCARP